MKKLSFFLGFALLLAACQYEAKIDPESGSQIRVKSEGISYQGVAIEVNGKKSELKAFDYGDEIGLHFKNVEGFTRQNGKIYPGLKLLVQNKAGDTLLFYEDMYANEDPVSLDPVTLTATILAARPIKTNEIVTAKLDFWDKKGSGKMHVDFDFSTKSNDNLSIKNKTITYDEIYIFSEKNQRVVSDNQYDSDDLLYFIMEGLDGFKEENGVIFPCLMVEVKNENDEVILKEENILQAYFEDGVSKSAVNQKIYFGLSQKALQTGKKLRVHAVLIDKISEASLILDTEINRK